MRRSRCLLVGDCACVPHLIPASLFGSAVNSRGNGWIRYESCLVPVSELCVYEGIEGRHMWVLYCYIGKAEGRGVVMFFGGYDET